ncbi:MAG: polysaccharide biosynthesis tyrosine autokinase [Victivallales bacterium]|nr:polysaccharide biosynthesis tyrosine autokinase [Victivallales bacterium]
MEQPINSPAQVQADLADNNDNSMELVLKVLDTFVRPYIWLYIVSLALFLAAGFIYCVTAEKRYSSTAQMLISSNEARAINMEGLHDPTQQQNSEVFLRTQMLVLESDEILAMARKRMGEDGEDSRSVSRPKITRVPGTNLVNITVTSNKPETAAKFANTITEVYVDFVYKRRATLSTTGVDLLRDQLAEVQNNRQKAFEELLKFKEAHGVFDLKQNYDTLVSQKNDLMNKRFETQLDEDEITMTLEEIANNRNQAAIMLPYLTSGEGAAGLLSSIKSMELQHKMELPKLLQSYSQEHNAVKVHGQVGDELRKAAEEQVDITINGLKLKRQRIQKRRQQLSLQIADIEKQLVALDRLSSDYHQREAAANKLDETITRITNRISEIQIADATTIGNYAITKVNDAKKAHSPIFPQPKKVLLMAAIAGLAFAGLVSFILVSINNTVTEPAQISNAFANQVSIFGTLPLFSKDEHELLHSNGGDTVDEVFRDIRTSLNLSMVTRGRRVIAVSSALPSEGKTFVICNLARSFARDNKKVLLIDLDMRKPRMHKILRDLLPPNSMKRGISNVLVGDCALDDIIIHLDSLNMDVALVGPIPPNPNELVGSESFNKLLEEAKSKYDMVLMDTPPVLAVSDTLLIAAHDVALLIINRLFYLTKPTLAHLRDRLRQVNLKPAGIIINNVSVPKNAYGYGKYGYGKYGYGYGYGKYGYRYHYGHNSGEGSDGEQVPKDGEQPSQET